MTPPPPPKAIVERLLDPRPMTEEELELQVEFGRFMGNTGTFINFHHPFIVGLYSDEMEEKAASGTLPESHQGLAEAMLVKPRIAGKHEYIHSGDMTFERICIMFERAYRDIVAEVYLIDHGMGHDMSQEGIRDAFKWLWTDTEFPSNRPAFTDLFREFEHKLAPPFGDVELLDGSGITKVFRGIVVDEGDNPNDDYDNLSWTTSEETARWFSNRFRSGDQSAIVLYGEVNNDDVWLVTNDRGESEIVSDAVKVTGWKEH